MSAYMEFQLKGNSLCYFSRSERIVQALDPPYSEDYIECSASRLEDGLDELEEDKRRSEKDIQRYEKIVSNLKNADDIEQMYLRIQDSEDEIAEINESIAYIHLLLRIQEDSTSDEDKVNPLKWRFC